MQVVDIVLREGSAGGVDDQRMIMTVAKEVN